MQTKFPYRYAVYYNNTLLVMLNRTDEIDLKTKHTFVHKNKIYRMVWALPKIYVDDNYYIIPCSVICLGNVRYKWVASSNDGAFKEDGTMIFSTLKECYDDMRNSALKKMQWNTEYEDFSDMTDNEYIGYEVRFKPREIVHISYSGTYTYKVVEVVE